VQIGRPHLHYRSIGSTSTEALRLAAAGSGTGTIVTSDGQTSGRGRQGRPWKTPKGALAYSVVLRRLIEVPSTLPLQVGVGVCEAIEDLGVPKAQVKWPNDIWIEGRKVAGILVEARPQDGWAVIGIGLNVSIATEDFPEEVRDRAVSVNQGATLPQAIEALNEHLGRRLDCPVDETLDEFARRDGLLGRSISWEYGSGTAAGIDENGNLVVDNTDGTLSTLNAGEVHLDVGY